ncbi:YkgJ family cysteine cluster protein [Pseudomonas bubulae]|jgi:Fe-S-cluster containining protein|uniref:YkgJ family cysteine cluster protein n=1 Tax=Pseudomonas bubulae TaxID=2316085 RepID=UPI002B1D36DC|nr:YkgJ family cysteine cluster protein [Pseudomonas bubulae]
MSDGLFLATQLKPTGPSGPSPLFPCIKCGLCCKNLDKSPAYSYLNRGDGTCINFDSVSHLCKIYEVRPLICRVDEYYEKKLSSVMSRDVYIAANIQACRDIQAAENLIVALINSEDP